MLRIQTIVVIGTDKAAKIATARARAQSPESRIVVFEASDALELDMDARTITAKGDAKSECIHFDSLVFSGGLDAEPELKLLVNLGAVLNRDGTLFVDDTMCTSLEAVYACGNAVLTPNPSMIERSAQVAGTNAARKLRGHIERVKPCAGAVVKRDGDRWIGRTGVLADALVPGEFVRASVTGQEGVLTLLASCKNGTIIGGEISGHASCLRSLDVISLCVIKALNADDLIDLDVASESLGSGPQLLREAAEQLKNALLREKVAQWLAEHGERTLEILLQSN